MILNVKPEPAAVNLPVVVPAPTTKPLVEVVTLPLDAVEALPAALAAPSSGATRSTPLYSATLRSTYTAGWSKVAVTVLVAAHDVLGVVDRLADAGAAGDRRRQLSSVAGRVGDRGDVRGRVVPADHDDVEVAGRLVPS